MAQVCNCSYPPTILTNHSRAITLPKVWWGWGPGGQFPAQAYDAVNIMLAAVVKAYPDLTRDSLRDAVAATTDFPGVTGNTTFDENGEPLKELTKASVVGGVFVEVE